VIWKSAITTTVRKKIKRNKVFMVLVLKLLMAFDVSSQKQDKN